MVKVYNGITSGTIRREILEKYNIKISPSGYYRLAVLLDFPKGNKIKTPTSYTWTTYTPEEKDKIVELIKAKFSIV